VNIRRRIIDLIRPEGPWDGPDFRRRVEWLMLLRLMVTTLLLGITIFFQLRESRDFLLHPATPLYILIGTTFLLSLIYAFSLPLIPDLWTFSYFQVMVDVVYATVLVHFTGGASSVFTLLYIFPIITSGILHMRRGALLTAAATSVLFGLLVNLEFYRLISPSDWPWVSPWSRHTPGYLLWVLVVHFTFFFLAAILASTGAEQLQKIRISLTRRESDYQRLSELYTSIVRSIPSGIITTDQTDRITFVNSAGVILLGTPLSDLIGIPLRQVFPVVHNDVRTSKVRRETYLTVKEVNGDKRNMELTVSDLQRENDVPSGRLVVFHDVTQIRKMEDRVKLSEKQAAFVRIAAGMAHEIRNPLASLRGATELLSETSSGLGDQQKLLGIVIRESDRLNSLLGDFLLTVNRQPSKKARVLLTDLVEETVDLFASGPRIRQGVSLETLVHKGVEVEGDSTRLRQAVWNLLGNALDATPDGGVIRVVLESESGQAILKVEDSGPGIPPEIRDRIFEPFTTTKGKGTGLGLSLVLSVVEAHNGTVEAETAPGTGTVFIVRLPLASPKFAVEEGESENG
jgi:two-component system, NtrC family, sensor histidine kinase PilS